MAVEGVVFFTAPTFITQVLLEAADDRNIVQRVTDDVWQWRRPTFEENGIIKGVKPGNASSDFQRWTASKIFKFSIAAMERDNFSYRTAVKMFIKIVKQPTAATLQTVIVQGHNLSVVTK